jgi:hypothetical protein
MDFDHVRGEKKFYLGRGRFSRLDLMQEEAAKCDVVCACCHRTRTVNRRLAKKQETIESAARAV